MLRSSGQPYRFRFQYVGGKRIRKFVEKGGGIVEQRIYLGNEEVFERRLGIGFRKVVEQTLTEHVGGSLRVETKTIKSGKEVGKPVALFRHQLGRSSGLDGDGGGRGRAGDLVRGISSVRDLGVSGDQQ